MASVLTPEATLTQPAGLVRDTFSSLRGFFQDGAVRYGLKFGLAGILAVFISLYLRIPDPTWALFTVYVLMIAQYVGAIAEKSIFRLIGTVVGGVLGYIVSASLQQTPVIFLLIVGLVVGFCTAMFGQSRYPYAFFLCALTMVVVTSNGMSNPDQSWTYMLWRIEEVSIGVIATILVQSILWPRYAREEFAKNSRAACADLRDCFAASAQIFLHGPDEKAIEHAENFPTRISGLRMLLEFGGRESLYFRERLPTYFEITTCLSRIGSSIVTLSQPLPPNSFYRDFLHGELEQLHLSLVSALDDLSTEDSSPATRETHRKSTARDFQAFEDRLLALRKDSRINQVSADEATILGIHGLALDGIRRQIHRLHELLDSLPENPLKRLTEIQPFISPMPPPYWWHVGIKSAIAAVIALFISDWAKPPEPSMFVLGSWVFCAMSASSPGGQGDRKTFHYAAYNILLFLPFCIGLIAFTPMMSSYAVMNVVIFTWLFVWGYLSYGVAGVTIPMQLAMLVSVGILGLNAQEPVPFQAVAGVFFSIVLAQLLSALIQRLLWPSLPQWEVRNRFVEYLRLCQKVVTDGPETLPLWQNARLALIPGETLVRIHLLEPPICPVGEPDQLRAYLHSIQRVGSHLIVTMGKLGPLLPPAHAEHGKALISRLETEIKAHLQAQEHGIATSTPPAPNFSPLSSALKAWQDWIKELRAWTLKEDYPILESLRLMGLAGRYELAASDLIRARDARSKLHLDLYMGDYVL